MTADWRNQAACRGMDPGEFHPEVASVEEVGEALSVCGFCPVQADCLAFGESQVAPETGENLAYGVWGGQWFGDPPKRPAVRCQWCDAEIDITGRGKGGRPRLFCNKTCGTASLRARRAAEQLAS